MKIEHLLREANEFAHVFKLNGNTTYVVNEFNDLTAFCVPSLRRRGGQSSITYELGLLVLTAVDDKERAFIDGIDGRRYLALPRIVRDGTVFDLFVNNGRISELLLSDMAGVMEKYTISRKEALALIKTEEDFYIEKFRRVYSEKFDDRILKPLTDMV